MRGTGVSRTQGCLCSISLPQNAAPSPSAPRQSCPAAVSPRGSSHEVAPRGAGPWQVWGCSVTPAPLLAPGLPRALGWWQRLAKGKLQRSASCRGFCSHRAAERADANDRGEEAKKPPKPLHPSWQEVVCLWAGATALNSALRLPRPAAASVGFGRGLGFLLRKSPAAGLSWPVSGSRHSGCLCAQVRGHSRCWAARAAPAAPSAPAPRAPRLSRGAALLGCRGAELLPPVGQVPPPVFG